MNNNKFIRKISKHKVIFESLVCSDSKFIKIFIIIEKKLLKKLENGKNDNSLDGQYTYQRAAKG